MEVTARRRSTERSLDSQTGPEIGSQQPMGHNAAPPIETLVAPVRVVSSTLGALNSGATHLESNGGKAIDMRQTPDTLHYKRRPTMGSDKVAYSVETAKRAISRGMASKFRLYEKSRECFPIGYLVGHCSDKPPPEREMPLEQGFGACSLSSW